MAGVDASLWKRLSPHLDFAFDLPPADRASYLATLRTTDREAASELEAMLAAHDAAGAEGFLERSPAPQVAAVPAPGQMLGVYRLVTEIGRGGMGSVWLAERGDGRFQRKVAIKFLSIALIGRGEERFRREGGLLARLTHPNIAQLIDAGVTEGGQPYLVIEHVDGKPIDRYCDLRRLGVEARIELFCAMLAAVSDAHARLIVHRDLKPANVLVTNEGQVKLLDFGIAKLVDEPNAAAAETRLTRLGGWALTPEYAAPEQVAGAPISTATDVYSLGVMLYELLSGRSPVTFPVHAPLDLVRAVLDSAPRSMSDAVVAAGDADGNARIADARGLTPDRLRSRLTGDLDTIVRKAMKKEPTERYPSVTSLADDLRRYLGHEPIAARPDSAAYRAGKFARRNRVGVALAGFALVAAVGGIVATLYQARTARSERDYALSQLTRAEALSDLDHFLLSEAAPLGRPLEVNELLERAEQIVRRQSAGGVESRVNLLLSVGDQYRAMDESDRARSLLELAYGEAHATQVVTIRARSACALAGALAKGDGLVRAKELVADGLASLPEGRRYTLDRIYCLMKASYVAREDGAAAMAIERILEAQALLARAPYRSEIQELNILMNLAESYSQAGRHAEAAPVFEHAASVMAALGRDQTQSAGTLYNNWGLSLDLSGRPRDAEAIYRRAIELSSSGASDEAVSPMLLVNYGRALRLLGRLDESARYAEAGYSRGKEKGLEVVVNQSLLLRSSVYRDQGDIARSAAMLDEVEPRLRQALPSGHPGFGGLLIEQALTAQARGDSAEALRLIDEAYEIADAARTSHGATGYLPRVLIRRAELRNLAGHHAEAEADARLSLERLGDSLPPDTLSTLRADAYLSLGRALRAQGKINEARASFRLAHRHLQSALGSGHRRTIEVQEVLALPG
jgi:serine/threonine-protein kinase